MFNISQIATLATEPDCNADLALAVSDLLDELQELPDDEVHGHLRAAQDAVWDGAWGVPEKLREPLITAIGGALA